nr:MAG: hypothetical protein 1 [Leviviridae sp.]
MTLRTRSRVDNETRETFGARTEHREYLEAGSRFWLPQKGPWAHAPSGLSGHNLEDDKPSIEALKRWLEANWKDFSTTYNTESTVAIGYSRYGHSTVIDTPTKNFKKLSAQGDIINNAFSRTVVDFQSAFVEESEQLAFDPPVGTAGYSGKNFMFYLRAGRETTRIRSMALPREVIKYFESYNPPIPGSQTAINNAFGNIQQGEVELLVMAAEGRKTVQHLVSVVVRFAKLVRALRTGNFKDISPKVYKRWKQGGYGKAATAADVFADAWMEARYAWVPTVMDAIGAFNILTGNVEKRMTFRGRDSSDHVENIDTTVDCGFANVRVKALVFGDLSCRAGVLTAARIDSPSAQSTGIFNMATAVKELVPYSFVLEWFVNLSGLLYHLNPNPLLKPLAAWLTEIRELQISGTVEWKQSDGSVLTVPLRGRLSHRTRVPVDGPSIFTIDVNLGIARILDGAILLLRNLR